VCPIHGLKLIGLESVDVVLVDIETEMVETRAASNLFAILNPNNLRQKISSSSLRLHVKRFVVQKFPIP
jgi:hypothetical protein